MLYIYFYRYLVYIPNIFLNPKLKLNILNKQTNKKKHLKMSVQL